MSRDIDKQLVRYLNDAHGMELQSMEMLTKAIEISGDMQLSRGHLNDTPAHERYVKQRLEAMGQSPSTLKNIGAKAGAKGLGMLTQVMPDTPAKLAGIAFAYENFEIASYKMLRKVAEIAEDEETVSMCDRLIPVERQAAELIANNLDLAVHRSLEGLVDLPGPAVGRDPGPHA
ncbi:MAG: ferritin-like domain-containing protein [Actinomycetota bacterium]|nr:ferritin-like domain-containing protein [Actinomycetota bacterium]